MASVHNRWSACRAINVIAICHQPILPTRDRVKRRGTGNTRHGRAWPSHRRTTDRTRSASHARSVWEHGRPKPHRHRGTPGQEKNIPGASTRDARAEFARDPFSGSDAF